MDFSVKKAAERAHTYLKTTSPPRLSPQEQALILLSSKRGRSKNLDSYCEKTAQNTLRSLEGDRILHAPLHEVSIIFAALYHYNKKLVAGKYFATLATRLVKAEAAPGGPYYSNLHLDLETNVMIMYVFYLFKKALPNVELFITSHLNSGDFYALSPLARHLCAIMNLAKPVETPSQPLDVILRGSLPEPNPPSPDTSMILHTQQPDGSWHDDSGFLSPWTATLLAAQILEEPIKSVSRDSHHSERLADVKQELLSIPPELRPLGQAILAEIERLDTTQEVVLMPYFFADSFSGLDDSILALAARANIYCWMAYILYDRLLDGDRTPPESLPLMSFAMRKSHALYRHVASDTRAAQLVDSTFDTMDTTNAWEVRHTRFARKGSAVKITSLPRYGRRQPLANRSLGHILGPLLLARRLGASSAQTYALQQGLHHFLIARQLHDDIHDWVEDLQAGHASFVVTYLLRKIHTAPGTYPLKTLTATMRTEFWRRSLNEVNALTIKHATLSKKAFTRSRFVITSSRLIDLVDNLQRSAMQAEIEHEKYRNFLDEFSRDKTQVPATQSQDQ